MYCKSGTGSLLLSGIKALKRVFVCVKVFVYKHEYRECCSVEHYNTLYTPVYTQKYRECTQKL